MRVIANMPRTSRATVGAFVMGAALTLLAAQSACFSAPAMHPGTDTAVIPEDPNTSAQGITSVNSNETASAAEVAGNTLRVASDAAPPANTATLLADANAMATVDGNDFVPLVQAFGILYNNNPAAYYVTLEQALDVNLRGAIQYALFDTLNYHAVTLRDNAATAAAETAQFMTYWQAVRTAANPALYSAWAVPGMYTVTPALTTEANTNLPQVATLVPGVSNHDAVVTALTAAAPANAHGVDGNAFAQVCITLVPMYETSLIKYYQVLTQIPDKLLRDVVNFAVTDAVANHPTILTQADGGAAIFSTESWPYYGRLGFAGTAANLATFTAIALDPNGPLQGKPYPMMQ